MKSRILLLTVLALLAGFVIFTIQADPPAWWTNYGVLGTDENGPLPEDDYAVINQGQLKHLALSAYWMLEGSLPGGAGQDLHDYIATFYDFIEDQPNVEEGLTDDFAVVNQGQLKAMAAPFYDRLIQVGYITHTGTAPSDTSAYPWLPSGVQSGSGKYPWDRSTSAADNYAAANIGQAKYLFAFDPAADTDDGGAGDGLPDWWEAMVFGDLDQSASTDFDNDGISDLGEFYANSDPNDPWNGEAPRLEIVSGNGQGDFPGEVLAHPLMVRVVNGMGASVLRDAPDAVEFEVTSSVGQLSLASNGANPATAQLLDTGPDGAVPPVYVVLPATPNEIVTVSVSLPGYPAVLPMAFTATVGDSGAVPIGVSGIDVIQLSPTEIKIQWRDLSFNETGFTVQRRMSSNSTWESLPPGGPWPTVGANVTEYTDDSVSADVLYFYRIITNNASYPGVAVTPSPPTPLRPILPMIRMVTGCATWTKPSPEPTRTILIVTKTVCPMAKTHFLWIAYWKTRGCTTGSM